jgi:hypothetical protein
MNAQFSLFASPSDSIRSVPTEHTYVLSSDNHTWNCFGAYSGGRPIRTSNGSSEWAKLLYGPNEANEDQNALAVGMKVRYHGVCQNAANRILALTNDNIDARGSRGNAFATLMFGKFGFNIQQYKDLIQSTGQQVLQAHPGEISLSDIQNVLARIDAGLTPDAELDILHTDLSFEEHDNLPDITDAQRTAFRPIYDNYQKERAAAFLAVSNKYPLPTEIAFGPLKDSLIGPWLECIGRLIGAVGLDQFQTMFGVTPEIAKQALG